MVKVCTVCVCCAREYEICLLGVCIDVSKDVVTVGLHKIDCNVSFFFGSDSLASFISISLSSSIVSILFFIIRKPTIAGVIKLCR